MRLSGTLFLCHSQVFLDLGYNDIRIIPPEIGQLKKIRGLNLRGNRINSVSEEIGELTHLKKIDLESNCLTQLPPEINNLSPIRRGVIKPADILKWQYLEKP